jgi:RimJ/RimL family protein N-acetyltransferase
MNSAARSSIERITTPRLLLRELRLTDFETYARHRAVPEANVYVGGAVDRRNAWRMFASLTGQWMVTGAGWWAVEVRDTAEFIGVVGAFYRDTSLPLEPWTDIELGWSLFQPHWGNGYATEAARAALTFAFEHHRAPRAIAHIAAANVASVGVAKKIGMAYEREVDFYGEPISRYVLARA